MAVAKAPGVLQSSPPFPFAVGAKFELIEALEGYSWFKAKLFLGAADYKTGKVATNLLELTPEEIAQFDLPLDSEKELLYRGVEVEYIGGDDKQGNEVLQKGDLLRVEDPWYSDEEIECKCQKLSPSTNSDGRVVVRCKLIKRRT